MRNRFFARAAGFLVLALVPATAWAAGFGISEFGSKASGRAYAGIAAKDSASMVWWNPAQLTQMDGLQLSLGVAIINVGFDYAKLDGSDPTESTRANTTPPSLFVSYKLGEQGLFNWSVGAGFCVPFGSAVEWPADFSDNMIYSLGLRVYEGRFVTALSLGDQLSIGGAVRVIGGGVEAKQSVAFGSAVEEGYVDLAGQADVTTGFSLAASLHPHENFTLALTYRSDVDIHFTGNANYHFVPPFEKNDENVEADITLPWELMFGVAWEVMPKRLTWTADLGLEAWSSYEELRINFFDDDGNLTNSSASPRESENAFKFRTGVEYQIMDIAAVRAGYLYDPNVTPEENVGAAPPDSNSHIVSVGASYYWNWLGVHAHFLYAIFAKRTVTTSELPGVWEGGFGPAKAFIYGASVSAQWDIQPALIGRSNAAAE
jgi:long-chain fatty acid transport protein